MIALEKLPSHQPAAVHFAGVEKEIDMETPRMVMPLLNFTDKMGNKYEVLLHQTSHQSEPRIKILRWAGGSEKAFLWMDFSVSALLSIETRGEVIKQAVGDGPEIAEISESNAFDIAKLALGCLPPTAGRFEIVWVPDDGLPF